MSTVAICIPTYNQACFLEAAVRSALTQTHTSEIWVSDDASTDETSAVMEEICREFPRVHYHRQKQNLGIRGNPTWVMKQPDAEFIVRLDSDDVLQPDYVEKLYKVLEAYPKAGYAHAAVREIGEAGAQRRLRLLARSAGYQNCDESLRVSVSGYRVAANICMFRHSALKQVGYYRRDLSFAEDWDLATRLADAGWGNVYVNEILASYRVWDTRDGVKGRRKLSEIQGCCRVIEDSLTPAFLRRNWDTSTIARSRRHLAMRHAECLRSNLFSLSEQNDLKRSLILLGDSLALRLKFRWIRTPLAPLFELPFAVLAYFKSQFKAIVFLRTKLMK